MHEHISSLLGEHPRIVNIFLGPMTVHYREVSLYIYQAQVMTQSVASCMYITFTFVVFDVLIYTIISQHIHTNTISQNTFVYSVVIRTTSHTVIGKCSNKLRTWFYKLYRHFAR